jgi:hypothetical protein
MDDPHIAMSGYALTACVILVIVLLLCTLLYVIHLLYNCSFDRLADASRHRADKRRATVQRKVVFVKAPEPVKVLLLGHSYPRRLRDFMTSEGFNNMGFPATDVEVSVIAQSGATLRPGHRHISNYMGPLVDLQPAIVYLHIGENDVGHLSAPQIGTKISNLVAYLLPFCRVVVVSCLVPFEVFGPAELDSVRDVASK